MSGKKSDPPKRAIWLLRHLGSASRSEALTGDLVERFREGKSSGWFWKQAFIAITVGVLSEIRRHWPQVCYAIAGTLMISFGLLGRVLDEALAIVPWWSVLPWPWSMLVSSLIFPAVHTLAALPVLSAALLMKGAFRWVSLLRTSIINLTLLTIVVDLLGLIGPHNMPAIFGIPLFFSIFVASAWLGSRSPRSDVEGIRTVNH
jgi:hypothetical protein